MDAALRLLAWAGVIAATAVGAALALNIIFSGL
jgi:hypothetical protein